VTLSYNSVRSLISLLCEVEVVIENLIASTCNGGAVDLHIKFTPSSLVDTEWRFLEGYVTHVLAMLVKGSILSNIP
jgi:hypothetical protein